MWVPVRRPALGAPALSASSASSATASVSQRPLWGPNPRKHRWGFSGLPAEHTNQSNHAVITQSIIHCSRKCDVKCHMISHCYVWNSMLTVMSHYHKVSLFSNWGMLQPGKWTWFNNIMQEMFFVSVVLLHLSFVLVLRVCSHHGSNGKEVGMVAALLKVHHDVEQGDLISSALRIQSLKVLGQNQLVVFPVSKNNNNKIKCYSLF